VILLPNFFSDPLLQLKHSYEELDELDEKDEKVLQERFKEFFEDIHPEFQSVGEITQLKVRPERESIGTIL
jgi:hypothetical protein